MAVTYAQSTYSNLITDIRLDVNEETRLAGLPDELIQSWINRAQERVTDLVEVKDQYTLGLKNLVTDYYFQDRPAITAATNATPIVITSASHGLANLDRVLIRGVLGNLAANGSFQVSGIAANTFNLNLYADISSATAGTTTVTVTTKAPFPFASGDTVTITGVLGMTDLNASFVITTVDISNFTVSLVTTQNYTSGGVCTESAIGNGVYTTGGRFWKSTDIPTFFKDIKFNQRTWSNTYKPSVNMVEMDYLLAQQKTDTDRNLLYWDYNSPSLAAIARVGASRFLHVYPAPTYDQDMTLTAVLRILGRLYDSDPLTTNIILTQEYEAAIIAFAKMRVYDWMKDTAHKAEYMAEFNGEINRLRLRNPAHIRLSVTYQ